MSNHKSHPGAHYRNIGRIVPQSTIPDADCALCSSRGFLKFHLRVLFICSLVALSVSPEVLAQSITASLPNVSAAPGQQNVEVPILVSDTSGLGVIAADVELEYDSSRLNFADVSVAGTISESWSAPIVNATILGNIRMALYGVTELSGTGSLVTIIFDVKEDAPTGQSALVLVKCRFNDGQSISTILADGAFTVTGDDPTPTPTATPSATASPAPSIPPPLFTPTPTGHSEVTPGPLPATDLAVTRIKGPKSALRGGKFNVRITVNNHTSQDAANAALTLFVAPVKRSAKLRRIGGLIGLSIPANSTHSVSLRAKIPVQLKQGDYLLSAEILADSDTNPGNNRLVRRKPLQVGH